MRYIPGCDAEQVKERVSPMLTGFETAFILENPGLTERKPQNKILSKPKHKKSNLKWAIHV